MRTKVSLLVFATVALLAPRAEATPNFPPFIHQQLGLAADPDCSLCHTDGDQGGLGTVNTPFGRNMRERGLVAFDTNSLKNALDQMAAEHVDSIGDCLDDIDELKAGRSPNVPDPPGTCPDGGAPMTATETATGPSYGCEAAPAPATSGSSGSAGASWLAALVVAGALVLSAARRRLSASPSAPSSRR